MPYFRSVTLQTTTSKFTFTIRTFQLDILSYYSNTELFDGKINKLETNERHNHKNKKTT